MSAKESKPQDGTLQIRRALGLIVLTRDESAQIADSYHGFRQFSIVRFPDQLKGICKPKHCLIYSHESSNDIDCYLGYVNSKQKIATTSTRIKFTHVAQLGGASPSEISRRLHDSRLRSIFKSACAKEGSSRLLPKKLGYEVWRLLQINNASALHRIERLTQNALHRPLGRKISGAAILDAVSIFGEQLSRQPDYLATHEQKISALEDMAGPNHLFEDRVIEHDARGIPGWAFIKSDMTGMAVFEKDGRRLIVFTANRGPVEHATGADLIYINATMGNAILLQYKMLEEATDKKQKGVDKRWLYRPDAQFHDEITRMKSLQLSQGQDDDYRLSSSPFFFKFVRRVEQDLNSSGITISLDHLELILASRKSKGPKGGIRIDFNELKGRYLRKSDLVGLIHSGYVGTFSSGTIRIEEIIKLSLSRENRTSVIAHEGTSISEDEFPNPSN